MAVDTIVLTLSEVREDEGKPFVVRVSFAGREISVVAVVELFCVAEKCSVTWVSGVCVELIHVIMGSVSVKSI